MSSSTECTQIRWSSIIQSSNRKSSSKNTERVSASWLFLLYGLRGIDFTQISVNAGFHKLGALHARKRQMKRDA